MIRVKSYIWVDRREFVPIRDFTGPVKDPEYIEGAIELEVDSERLFTLENWDLVDQLWGYLVDGLVHVRDGQEFATRFPDNPAQIVMKRSADKRNVVMQVSDPETRIVRARYGEFMQTMTEGAREFFEHLTRFLPRSDFDFLFEQLNSLEEHLRTRS